jgi:hypothetical protein
MKKEKERFGGFPKLTQSVELRFDLRQPGSQAGLQ